MRNWVNCETQRETAVYVNEQQTELRYERSNHRLSHVVLVFRSPQLALQTTVYTMFENFARFRRFWRQQLLNK